MTQTENDTRAAVEQLAKSRIGRNAMRHVLAWLDEDGLNLDMKNQEAILSLLDAAWGEYAGTARDLMRAELEG